MALNLIYLLVMVGPIVVLGAVEFMTNGTSGPQCGTSRCLGGNLALCVDGECVCQAPASDGLGNLVCHRPDEDFGVVFNDPMVRGFDESHTKIPLVCKFLAAHISTNACTGATPDNVRLFNGMCNFRLYVWGRRKRGKTFVRGIQISVVFWLGTRNYFHTSRVDTEAFNGQYLYSEDGKLDPTGGGVFGTPVVTIIPGLGRIYTVYDGVNNFARIIAQPCGIEVGIRGAEQIGNPLLLPAGVYLKVLKACGPTYLSNENAVFSPPPGQGLSLAEQAQLISEMIGTPVTPMHVAVYKAFTGQHLQDFPNAPMEVQMLADTIQECDLVKVYQAFNFCLFIIDIPRFFYCYDKTNDGRLALGLMDECVFSICDGNRFMCEDVQAKVINTGCQSKLRPGQLSILNFACESL